MHDVPYFDAFAPVYDLVMPAADRASLTAGLAHADRDIDHILDLGGGTGRAARAVGGATVVDASREMLVRAARDGFPVVQADVGELPVRSDGVDAAIVVDALHHFPDAEAALEAAARVVRPGGVLVVREFDPTTVRGRLLEAAEHAIRFESTFYSPAAIADRLDDAGFASHVVDRGFAYTVAGVREQRSE